MCAFYLFYKNNMRKTHFFDVFAKLLTCKFSWGTKEILFGRKRDFYKNKLCSLMIFFIIQLFAFK